MSLLTVDDLVKDFGGVRALNGVSIRVEEGEIFSIIGPNGAGKTTLINLVSRFFPADRGRIVFNDRDITRLPTHKISALGIGRTFQNIALFKGMTVLDNLMLGRQPLMKPGVFSSGIYWGLAQKSEKLHRRRVEEIIDFLEIAHIRKAAAGTLPYGFQKRVELGRALALDPRILLLDEPMAGMNLEEKEDMVRFILDINEELGIAVILIEHDMGVVMEISDRIAVLHQGEKIAEGPADQIRADPSVAQAYLGKGEAWN